MARDALVSGAVNLVMGMCRGILHPLFVARQAGIVKLSFLEPITAAGSMALQAVELA